MEPPDGIDRELRCTGCGTRVFTSRAPELAVADFRCPRCMRALQLMPGPVPGHEFAYPRVRPVN
jgi:DNA-directed RNA polymerase subunit RPC12/RpoP